MISSDANSLNVRTHLLAGQGKFPAPEISRYRQPSYGTISLPEEADRDPGQRAKPPGTTGAGGPVLPLKEGGQLRRFSASSPESTQTSFVCRQGALSGRKWTERRLLRMRTALGSTPAG